MNCWPVVGAPRPLPAAARIGLRALAPVLVSTWRGPNKPSCGEKADILISGLVQVKALRVPHLAPIPLSDQRVLF